VNITPRYLGRGSWLGRRDPRLLVLCALLFAVAVIQVWDGRLIAVLLLVALMYYRAASIPFRAVRGNWIAALTLVTIVVLVNTVLTGNRLEGVIVHPYFSLPLIGTVVSAESIAYAITQWMRYVAMVAVGFPVAFCVAPADFGVTFARLRIPYKFAFAVDLTFRFIPSLANEFSETIDAQRVRGFDPSAGRGGFLRKVQRMIPILTPLTVNAIAGAEDTIDAMDLRAFGTGKRTWLRQLAFDRTDRLVLLAAVALVVVVTVAGFTTSSSRPWTPPFLIDLAGR
jgi:energy-coupling factor transport system permease protein